MTVNNFDAVDVPPSIAWIASGIASMGIGDMTVLGTKLTDPAVVMGASEFSFALLLGLLSGVAILFTNKKHDVRSWDTDEYAVGGGLFALMIGVEAVPGLNSFIWSNSLIGLSCVGLLSVGIWWLGYKR